MIFVNVLKNLFIPGRKNNYRAKILHPSFLAFFVFFFLINQTLLSFVGLIRTGILGYSSNITPEKIVDLTNEKRNELGLSQLKINSLLSLFIYFQYEHFSLLNRCYPITFRYFFSPLFAITPCS